MKRRVGILLYLGAYGAAILGSWAWFNVAPARHAEVRRLTIVTNLPGFSFTSEPLDRSTLEILGAPQYLNGSFVLSVNSARSVNLPVRVFSASWPAVEKQSLAVVQHTPDVCWVGAGWQLSDVGQPTQVEVSIPNSRTTDEIQSSRKGSSSLVFECRAFLSPDRRSEELVLWCTLIGGDVLPESSIFRTSKGAAAMGQFDSNIEKQLAVGRRLSADYFVRAVRQRLRARGVKQFVRLSAPIKETWRETLQELTQFAGDMLLVEDTKSQAPGLALLKR